MIPFRKKMRIRRVALPDNPGQSETRARHDDETFGSDFFMRVGAVRLFVGG